MPWTVSGGVMTTMDSHERIFRSNEASPPYVVTVRAKGEAEGDQLLVMVGVNADSTTYLYAQITLSNDLGLLTLSNETGDTLAQVSVPALTPGDWHSLRVCLSFPAPNDGLLVAIITTAQGVKRYVYTSGIAVPDTYNADRVGLGTGNIISSASFDNFLWQRERSESDPDCPICTKNCYWGSLCVGSSVFSDWEQVSGNWQCGTTSDDSAILKFLTPHPENIHRHRLHGLISSTHDQSQILFYVRYKDANTYLAGRVTFDGNCGLLEILQNGAVLDSLNVSPLTSSASSSAGNDRLFPLHFLCVSYDGEYLSAHLGPGGGQALSLNDQYETLYRHLRAAVTPDPDGIYVAIGTGNNFGTVTIDDLFVSSPFSDEHPFCDTCYTCVLTAGGQVDVSSACEFVFSGDAQALNDEFNEPLGVLLSTVGSYAAYKGNIGDDNAYVDVTFQASSDNQILRIHVNTDGLPTGPYVEVTVKNLPDTGLFRLSSGEQEIVSVDTIAQHQVLVCLNSGALTGVLNPGIPLGIAPGDASLYGSVNPASGKYVVFELLGSNGDMQIIAPYYARGSVPKHAGSLTFPTTCSQCVFSCDCCEGGVTSESLLIDIRNLEASGRIGGDTTFFSPACATSADFGGGPISDNADRICEEVVGMYVLRFSNSCQYHYSERRIWQTNDEQPGGGDDSYFIWTIALTAKIVCGAALIADDPGCPQVASGKYRVVLEIAVRIYTYSPPVGESPEGPYAPNQPVLIGIFNAHYYSQEFPNGSSCVNFSELELTPLSWDTLIDPECGPFFGCNTCGIVGDNSWTSAHSVYASSL